MSKADRSLIAAYATRRQGERFRITRSGEVHIYGPMPNSIESGWWFAGYEADLLSEMKASA